VAVNTQQDSILQSELYYPYNRILASHDDSPRIVEGLNTFVTLGGKLSRRPATLEVAGAAELGRIDRLFQYETLNGRVYLLASLYDSAGDKWTMFYNRLSASTGWVQIGNLRSCDDSAAPQEVSIARGLAYIRNVPKHPGTDPYGTAVFDGSATPTLSLWGLPPPSVPAAIDSNVSKLTADITDIQTSITVTGFTPALSVLSGFTIVIDGEAMLVTGGDGVHLTVIRGYAGTTANFHFANTQVFTQNFGSSDHYNLTTSPIGWSYAYAWVSSTGQVSNRSTPQTNPDLPPDVTGPIESRVPKVYVQGHADTVHIPYIALYRTTDGGGNYYFLEQMVNPGAGPVAYEDNSLASGPSSSVFNDPVPDLVINTRPVAPDLTSNSPPPTNTSPDVVGIDPPIQGTPIAYFAGRHWYGLREYLVFSGNEEITQGVPEECFPAGLSGNYFRFQHPIINMRASTSALYVTTIHDTYVVTGTTRDTFAVRPLYKNLGSPYGQPLSMATYGDKVITLTNDYRVAVLEGDKEPRIISDPLYTDIVDAINLGGEAEVVYWGDLEKEWIMLAIHNKADTSKSRQFVYDVKLSQRIQKDFWFTPWSIPSVSAFSGRLFENSSQRRLSFFVYNPTINYGTLVRIDPTARTNTDATMSDAFTTVQTPIDYYLMFQQHIVPAGNHVNMLRMPNLSVVVNQLTLERILYPGDEDPKVYYYLDDLWSDPISTTNSYNPARRPQSTGYKTMVYPIEQDCFRFTFRIQGNQSVRPFDLLGYVITYNPDNGA